jgi:hypothetical protein
MTRMINVINMISTMHSANVNDVIDMYGHKKIEPGCTVGYKKYVHGADVAGQYRAV